MSTMLVGSHAEDRGRTRAAAAPLADAIGNIETATASAPRRASDTATQVMAGDPRSRRPGGETGILSLTALTFSLMKEARAADPNAIFLDDDNITYKDFEHGAFELVTKEAVPRHIIVEDPGVTVVLRPQGSSVSVNQVTNSPARMAELQAGPAGGARYRHERGGVDRVEHTSFRRFAIGATDQLHSE